MELMPEIKITTFGEAQAGSLLLFVYAANKTVYGLKVKIPGDPTERTYGPPPAADGNPQAYLFAWDKTKKTFMLSSG